jgi:hypothetical protein
VTTPAPRDPLWITRPRGILTTAASLIVSASLVITAYVIRAPASDCGAAAGAVGTTARDVVAFSDRSQTGPDVQDYRYVVDFDTDPATLKRAGSLVGQVPAGNQVWLLSHSLETTLQSDGKPGTERVYPIAKLSPDARGCWAVTKRLPFAEAIGLTFRDDVVLVDDATAADFTETGSWSKNDGFARNYLQTINNEELARADLPTEGWR